MSKNNDDYGQPEEMSDRIRKGDKIAYSIPFPFKEEPFEVTINEKHAVQYGIYSGILYLMAAAAGYKYEAFIFAASLVAVSYGLKFIPVKKIDDDLGLLLRTIIHEPHWFLTSFIPFLAVAIHYFY